MTPDPSERPERFLLIVLLASLAFAQPLFNLLGSQAEFLVAHGFDALELVTFALSLGILLPMGIALLPGLAARVEKSLGRMVFYLLRTRNSGTSPPCTMANTAGFSPLRPDM